jgi:hypothetical protein
VTEEDDAMTDIPANMVELALEWAACRRAITRLDDLTEEERDEFALLAATALLGLDVKR